jgi:replicative DNA helicase
MPANLEAEQAVLAAILLNNRALEYVGEYLKPEHFVHPAHQKIYEVATKYFAKGAPIDAATIKDYLAQSGALDDLGGTEYLSKLVSMGAGVMDIKSYGRIVYDNFIRREIIDLGQKMIQEASVEDLDRTVDDNIESAEQKLFELAQGDATKDAKPAAEAFKEAFEAISEVCRSESGLSGLTTGFRDLDAVLHGLRKSELTIVAGRPGMGKTTVAMNMAFNAADAILKKQANPNIKGAVVFFSLEMSREELAGKILSSYTRIQSDSMRAGTLTDKDLIDLANAANLLKDLPLMIDETPALSVAAIRAKTRRIARKYGGVALIVIDYLQLMQSAGGRRNDNRVQEISEITRGLKMLAKDLDVPIVALSQLSRSVESQDRKSKKPILSDLRDSGSIEQDADIVMFTYREWYYLTNKDPEDNIFYGRAKLSPEDYKKRLAESEYKAELVIGKNRHGPVKDVVLNCRLDISLFSDLDVVPPQPAPRAQNADDAPALDKYNEEFL